MFPADQLSCDREEIFGSESWISTFIYFLSLVFSLRYLKQGTKLILDFFILTMAKLQLDWKSKFLFYTLHTNQKHSTNFYTLMPYVGHLFKSSMSTYVIQFFFSLEEKSHILSCWKSAHFFLVGSNSLS